jgi:hypothetical protein
MALLDDHEGIEGITQREFYPLRKGTMIMDISFDFWWKMLAAVFVVLAWIIGLLFLYQGNRSGGVTTLTKKQNRKVSYVLSENTDHR